MSLRPIDIARRLKISTTTLRLYEEAGIIPPVKRSPSGYRIYTDAHLAYFICIREMMHGFTLSEIAKMLKEVRVNKQDEALWIANKAQAALQKDKLVCEQIRLRFIHKKVVVSTNDFPESKTFKKMSQSKELTKAAGPKEYTIDAVSKLTCITPSTIRYWDKVGLISASRCAGNNYRTFTQTNIDEILMIQALKLAMRARGEKYAVEQLRKELHELNLSETEKISAIVAGIENHLATLNRAQIRSIYALYSLCTQIENNCYEA